MTESDPYLTRTALMPFAGLEIADSVAFSNHHPEYREELLRALARIDNRLAAQIAEAADSTESPDVYISAVSDLLSGFVTRQAGAELIEQTEAKLSDSTS